MEVSVILNVMEYPSATTARVYPRWWRITDGVAEVVRVCVDEHGRPYTGPAYDPVPVRDDGRWRGPCLALPQYADMFADPWRPGAHDEERLAVGGRQQVVTCDHHPFDGTVPDGGYEPAPGGPGRWAFAGLAPLTDYAGDAPATYTTKAWTRWLVPVQP